MQILNLPRLNCSTAMMLKLCKCFGGQSLSFLNLSGNYLPYFCIDALVNQSEGLPHKLDLTNTRLNDLSAYRLISAALQDDSRRAQEIILAKNPLLSNSLCQKVVELLSLNPVNKLCVLNLDSCSISEKNLVKL